MDRNLGRFKQLMGDKLKLCLRQVMSMSGKNADSILIEDPVRRFLLDEFCATNNRGDDGFTAKELID